TLDPVQGLPALRAEWVRDRGDVEEIDGRAVSPQDNGYLSEVHAASSNGRNGSKKEELRFKKFKDSEQKPLRARAGRAVTQLYYARQGIITPEMEFIAIRENLGIARQKEELRNKKEGGRNGGAGLHNSSFLNHNFARNDLAQQHRGESFGANIPSEITSE